MDSALSRLLQRLEQKFRIVTFVTTMVPTMGALGLQFITFAITVRGLGVEQFGRYTALLAIVGVGVELTGLGGADLLVRAVSRDRARFRAYYGNMLMLIAITLPIAVALGVAVALGAMHSPVELLPMVVALAGEIAVARMSASMELVMVAHGHMAQAGWLRVTTMAVRLLLAIAFFMLLDLHGLNGWIAAIFIQAVVMTLTLGMIGSRWYGRPLAALMTKELSGGVLFCVNQTSRAMQSNLDRMVLSRYADDTALGLYGAASRIVQLGMFPVQVLTRIFYPKFFVHGANGLRTSRRYAIRVAPALFGVGACSSLAVTAVALLAPRILGAEFAGSIEVAIGLSIALPFIALQYPAADALTGAGLQGVRAAISSVFTVGFGFALVAGAKLGGIDGLIGAFVSAQLSLALALWIAAFVCRGQVVAMVAVADDDNGTGSERAGKILS